MLEGIEAIVIAVTGGVMVSTIGAILKTLWLDPLQKFKELKCRIAFALSYYGRDYTNVIDIAHSSEEQIADYLRVADEFRKLACELNAFSEIRYPIHWFIPSNEVIVKASSELMGLSNSFFCPYKTNRVVEHGRENWECAKKIRAILKLSSGDMKMSGK